MDYFNAEEILKNINKLEDPKALFEAAPFQSQYMQLPC